MAVGLMCHQWEVCVGKDRRSRITANTVYAAASNTS